MNEVEIREVSRMRWKKTNCQARFGHYQTPPKVCDRPVKMESGRLAQPARQVRFPPNININISSKTNAQGTADRHSPPLGRLKTAWTNRWNLQKSRSISTSICHLIRIGQFDTKHMCVGRHTFQLWQGTTATPLVFFWKWGWNGRKCLLGGCYPKSLFSALKEGSIAFHLCSALHSWSDLGCWEIK